jgi:dTMP kinase
VRQEFLQISLLDPERYIIIDGNQSIDDIHADIIERVSEISGLKRNAREDKGNLLLRPIRAVEKAVRSTAAKTSASATKAVKNATKKSPAKKKTAPKK